MSTTTERHIKAANEHAESASRIMNKREELDWHQANSAIAQLTQAVAAMNRYLGALEQKDEK